MNTVKIDKTTYEIEEEVSDLIIMVSKERDQLRTELAKSHEEVEKLESNKERERQHRRTAVNNYDIELGKNIALQGKLYAAEADSKRYREALNTVKELEPTDDCGDYYHDVCGCTDEYAGRVVDIVDLAISVDTDGSKGEQ